jgi:hypothetical protein
MPQHASVSVPTKSNVSVVDFLAARMLRLTRYCVLHRHDRHSITGTYAAHAWVVQQ